MATEEREIELLDILVVVAENLKLLILRSLMASSANRSTESIHSVFQSASGLTGCGGNSLHPAGLK